MPEKYHIDVKPAEPRFEPVSRLSSIEKDRCLGCLDCAKRNCIYDVYEHREFLPGQLVDSAGSLCKSCMRCVQECRNQILVKLLNPEFAQLGNEYWKPQLINSLWQQAQTGKIPVSGAGYDGPFSGPGFDGMWTDMSEIVRPTRDGIHGREYISTSIDIGPRPDHLYFRDNDLVGEFPTLFSIPLPIILDIPERARSYTPFKEAVLQASKQTHLFTISDEKECAEAHVVPRYRLEEKIEPDLGHKMIEIYVDSNDAALIKEAERRVSELSDVVPNTVICVGLPLNMDAIGSVLQLAEAGVGTVHLYADSNGREIQGDSHHFIKDVVRQMHLRLVREALRDRITLLAGGGIAMAEHVAKLIACGADGAVVDDALLVALECRMCLRCLDGKGCDLDFENMDPVWGAQRMVNLLGSWHAQLIEVLGAMGLREVRRLRGEVGRVMFFEDLEEECFAPMFGKRRRGDAETVRRDVACYVSTVYPNGCGRPPEYTR